MLTELFLLLFFQADKVLTGGDNACTIWKAFAKRGLGPDATVVGSTPWGGGIRTEDNAVPKACRSKQ
jgi:extracellular elastinolytic metalloproteinase